jgi:hypothetical protein
MMNLARLAEDYAIYHKNHEEVEEKYWKAEQEYRNSEVVKEYYRAKSNLHASLEGLKGCEEDLLAAIKQPLPVFIDLGETGVFIGPDKRIVVAPIVDQE